MKKILLLAATAALAAACGDKENKATTAGFTERDSLIQVINQKDEELNDIMATFNDIQEGFRQINEAENRVNLDKGNPEKSSKNEILDDIAFIQRTMQLNRERIAKLKEQLRTSSIGVQKLQATIENMQKELDEKQSQVTRLQEELDARDVHIAEQDKKISDLNTNVSTLSAQNEDKARTVAAQDKQLNTAWYVFGTKKELKEHNILQNGNVLRSGKFNRDYLTAIDIRTVKTIPLYSKRAKLLTTHPAGSYTLDRNSGEYTLHITNPQAFWSVSRYLVIEVK